MFVFKLKEALGDPSVHAPDNWGGNIDKRQLHSTEAPMH